MPAISIGVLSRAHGIDEVMSHESHGGLPIPNVEQKGIKHGGWFSLK